MSKQNHQITIPAAVSGSVGGKLVGRVMVSSDGTLERLFIKSNIVNTTGSPIVFDFRLNGVSIYPGAGTAPSIANGQNSVDQSLDVEVTEFQVAEVWMMTNIPPLSPIGNNLYIQFAVEDGGVAGPQGVPGPGVPVGGDEGQVLAKASGTNFDTEWVDQTGGGGGGTPDSSFYQEDFLGDELGNKWVAVNSCARIDGEANHPGLVRATSTGSFTVCGLGLANPGSGVHVLSPVNMFDIIWIIRPNQNDVNAVYRVGLFDDDFAATFVNGIFFQKTTTDNEFFGETRASSISSRTSGNGVYTATDWIQLRIRRIDAGTIGFTYNNGTEKTLTTNIPTVGMIPAAYVASGSGTKTLDVDYFHIGLNTLVRF